MYRRTLISSIVFSFVYLLLLESIWRTTLRITKSVQWVYKQYFEADRRDRVRQGLDIDKTRSGLLIPQTLTRYFILTLLCFLACLRKDVSIPMVNSFRCSYPAFSLLIRFQFLVTPPDRRYFVY